MISAKFMGFAFKKKTLSQTSDNLPDETTEIKQKITTTIQEVSAAKEERVSKFFGSTVFK